MTMIDMTVPGMRENVALLVCTSRLSLEIKTGMGSRVSTLGAAKANGFTVAGTKHGALLDCIGLARVIDPEHEPASTTVAALEHKFGEAKATKEIAKALRRGDQFRAVLATKSPADEFYWRGVAYAYKG